jgi:hypothetical protein
LETGAEVKVRILGHNLNVVFVPADDPSLDGAWGRLFLDRQEIFVDNTLSDVITRETLFHEILHAADMMGSPRPLAESTIHRVSAILYATLRDNPKIVQWLFEEQDDA